MLKIKNIEVVYNEVVLVIKGLSLEVNKGEIVSLLGANGAGKSTTLKAISGLLKTEDGEITKGSVFFQESDITKTNPSTIVKNGIFQVMEGRRCIADMTIEENLRLGAHTRSDRKNIKGDIEEVMNFFPRLRERKGLSGYLSGGEQQMLAIGRALMSDPSYLLLDEPSLGLAPKLVDQIAELIKEINSQGVTVLLVEQNANMALNVSDHGYIMETGNIVMDNPSEMLLKDQDVREFYLGMNPEGTNRKSFRDVKHYKRKKRWLS